jgi:hypothetical protein
MTDATSGKQPDTHTKNSRLSLFVVLVLLIAVFVAVNWPYPHLEDLRIAGRVIDAAAIQSIVSHQKLHTLNLMRTNVSAEALQLLGELPSLQRLSLIHSDVELSEFVTPPNWTDVKDCPIDDAAVTSVLDSFPNLEHFAFTPSPGWNSAGVAGSVSRLGIVDKPNLKWLDMGDDPTSFIEQLRIVNAPDLALSLNISYANQLKSPARPHSQGLPSTIRCRLVPSLRASVT